MPTPSITRGKTSRADLKSAPGLFERAVSSSSASGPASMKHRGLFGGCLPTPALSPSWPTCSSSSSHGSVLEPGPLHSSGLLEVLEPDAGATGQASGVSTHAKSRGLAPQSQMTKGLVSTAGLDDDARAVGSRAEVGGAVLVQQPFDSRCVEDGGPVARAVEGRGEPRGGALGWVRVVLGSCHRDPVIGRCVLRNSPPSMESSRPGMSTRVMLCSKAEGLRRSQQ